MTKNILIFPLLATTFTHGMETNSLQKTPPSWSVIHKTQNINLTQQPLSDVINNINNSIKDNKHHVQHPYCINDHLCDHQQQENKTISCFTAHSYHGTTVNSKDLYHIRSAISDISSHFSHFSDQTIIGASHNELFTIRYHFVTTEKQPLTKATIQKSLKKLKKQYAKILNDNHNRLDYFSSYPLDRPILNISIGFPGTKIVPCALKTIFKFIKNSPDVYDSINFFVTTTADFALYKTLLWKHTGLLHKICLFYGGHKKQKNIISLLTYDIKKYIIQLI